MTEPKCRPLLLNAWEVPPILAGRKTRFSRIMSFQPDGESSVRVEHFHQARVNKKTGEEEPGPEIFGAWWDDGECGLKCPYGAPGDRLWGRESFMVQPTPGCSFGEAMRGSKLSVYYKDGTRRDINNKASIHGECIRVSAVSHEYPDEWYGVWRSPVAMPRWASRITLEVTGVRVERLQDITEAGAFYEGVERLNLDDGIQLRGTPHEFQGHPMTGRYEDALFAKWDLLHGAGAAALNPWVWACEFRRVEVPA